MANFGIESKEIWLGTVKQIEIMGHAVNPNVGVKMAIKNAGGLEEIRKRDIEAEQLGMKTHQEGMFRAQYESYLIAEKKRRERRSEVD